MNNSGFKLKLFTNKVIDKRQLKRLMSDIFDKYGASKCTYVADKLKFLGFRYATQAGLSLNIEDLRVPDTKKLNLTSAESYIDQIEEYFIRADLTSVDRFQYIIDKWSSVSEKVKEEVVKYFVNFDPFNPIYMMAFSGARGNLSQVRQLIGMRGLMADPQGQLIGLPIKSNFREGLTVTEYIISSYGARKGIVDTALRTADSGYLTRRLVDVSQDIIIKAFDCGTDRGIVVKIGSNITLLGRTTANDIYDVNGNLLLPKNEQINQEVMDMIKANKISRVKIRSSITCQLNHSICQLCYGWNLATRKLIDLGEAVGILAAQSIGEPGTQLTMRTFHTGGTFMGTLSDAVYAFSTGNLRVIGNKGDFTPKRFSQGEWNIKLNKNASLQLQKNDGRIISLQISKNSALPFTENNYPVKLNQVISKPPIESSGASEQVTKRISSDKQGLITFDNLTLQEKEDKNGNITQVTQSQGFVWVCLGDVLTIPTDTSLHVKKRDILKPNKCIVKSNIHNTFGGFYNERSLNNILLESYDLIDGYIKREKIGFKLFCSVLSENYYLSLTKKSFRNQLQVIGESIPRILFKHNSGRIKIDMNLAGTPSSSKLHLVPEYFFDGIDLSKKIFVKAGDFIDEGTEIFSGIFAERSGIVDILENENGTLDFVLRPGFIVESSSITINLSKNNKKVIPIPIEIADLYNLKAEGFVHIEQLNFDDEEQSFLISMVETHSLENEKELLFDNSFANIGFRKPFRIFEKINFLINDGDIIKDISSANIILKQLVFEFKLLKGLFNVKINLKKTDSHYGLRVDIYEKLSKNHPLAKSDNILKQKLVHKNQYIYASSKLFENHLMTAESSIVESIEKISSNRKLLCIRKKSDHQIFQIKAANEFKILKERTFLRRGDRFQSNLYAQAAGKIVFIPKNKDYVILQRSKPYLIARNSFLKVKEKYLIRKNNLIAFLTYEVAKTEDIIQGLPRVEEILEARPPKTKAIIANIPGYVSIINKSDKSDTDITPVIIQNQSNLKEYYNIPTLRKIVRTGDFVKLGDRLTDGQIDMRELLKISFDFYFNVVKLNNYSACVKSFRYVQTLLISEIQNVYKSQGVDISDKHIEIIVRQMTTKVKIEESGKTTLVPGELIDLQKIRRINAIAQCRDYETATYTPALLGITKASLNTDSFISAASFQETARVLTKAAVEGKKDWLNGLKENVIVGRLIPAGTGFTRDQLIKTNFDISTNNKNAIDEIILDKRIVNKE